MFAPLLLAPFVVEPMPIYRRGCFGPSRSCFRPAYSRGCFGPSPYYGERGCLGPFMLLAVLMFPCLLRIALSVFAFGAFVVTIASAASCMGALFSGCLSCPFPTERTPTTKQSYCKKTATPCAKKTAAAPPDHSSVSVTGSESSLTIVVSAPGVATNNLDVKLQPGQPSVLTIKGESTVAGSRRGVNRTIMLPRDVNIDEASATHADGVLTLTLPKKVTPAKQIKVEKAATKATPARCSPTHKAVVLAQIREGVQLKKTAGPQPRSVPPTEPNEPTHAESDEENAQWEVVKELAENIDAAILQELADMGFEDTALNSALLKKHAGSVNATVKELVATRRRRSTVESDKEAAAIAEAAG